MTQSYSGNSDPLAAKREQVTWTFSHNPPPVLERSCSPHDQRFSFKRKHKMLQFFCFTSGHILWGFNIFPPVYSVSIGGPDELLQQVLDVPAQPLVFLFKIKHLVHQQQHDSQGDVIIHLGMQVKGLTDLQGILAVIKTQQLLNSVQTHVVVQLGGDSTVFWVDVGLWKEWRHLYKKGYG